MEILFGPGLLFRNAVLGGLCVALACSLLGIYLVLRRLVLLGVALPQAGAAGIAAAFWITAHAHQPGGVHTGALLGSLTVGDNVALPFREHTSLPETVIRRVVESKLAMVGLPDTAHLMPAELSGGMRKRASLSRAMALDPDLLLCDEPSAGLDPIVAAGIDETLRGLQQNLGTTMLVVTHELASVALIADRVVMMHEGEVMATGTVDEMRSSQNQRVRDFFARKPPSTAVGGSGPTLLQLLEEEA